RGYTPEGRGKNKNSLRLTEHRTELQTLSRNLADVSGARVGVGRLAALGAFAGLYARLVGDGGFLRAHIRTARPVRYQQLVQVPADEGCRAVHLLPLSVPVQDEHPQRFVSVVAERGAVVEAETAVGQVHPERAEELRHRDVARVVVDHVAIHVVQVRARA